MTHVRPVLAIAVCGLLGGCFGPLEVSKVTSGSSEFDRLPEVMRAFPIWQPVDTPLYDFETRDGARRPSGGLRYTSTLPADAILEHFVAHAATIDCQLIHSRQHETRFVCSNDPAQALELHIAPAPDGTSKVGIAFLQTTPEFEHVSF